ncbi:hypothetical protein N7491_001988 [Penicillium cf. griseofulvum]|uniref:Uncharacterized protein n=1 Tax=Penicillium cf. griseofulvum TaxID=2972120 RepID=A0A9W9T2T2_9EURO|nr:hypothetical protein N7472_003827 [Penicillium cf. griseofulvum]KAJ5445906.1 hypothetical protein N7491_001988 [Penicillium cf. griseofulvum]KAJ5447630.1 hypothetical protein N7445_002451 [Penicillium cf. griseofulvum]
MPTKPSSRRGAKKGMSYTLSPHPSSSPIRKRQRRIQPAILEQVNSSSPETPKTESSAPSEYWNRLTELQPALFNGATQSTRSNHYASAEIKAEMPSPTPASVANGENESEYSFGLTPVPDPISAPLPCTEDDLTLCHASTADPTGYPLFVSRNGRWDWYYLASNNKTIESSTAGANDTANGNAKSMKSEFADLSLSMNQFPCTEDDMPLYPCPNPGANPNDNPTFSSQKGRWEWMFLPSNTDIESSPPKVKMEDIPEANPRMQRESNPLSTIDPDRFVFPFNIPDTDDDHSTVPSLVDNIAEQARTAKHVRFFMNTSHDKHFVPIEVTPLTGNENWEPWLAAMRLLFRQHSVWPIVTSELQPLPPGHNLYLWYQRMCDCAIGLIYTNVSEEVRKSPCFMSTVREDDPDVLMSHLYAHYSSPDSNHIHVEDELD